MEQEICDGEEKRVLNTIEKVVPYSMDSRPVRSVAMSQYMKGLPGDRVLWRADVVVDGNVTISGKYKFKQIRFVTVITGILHMVCHLNTLKMCTPLLNFSKKLQNRCLLYNYNRKTEPVNFHPLSWTPFL